MPHYSHDAANTVIGSKTIEDTDIGGKIGATVHATETEKHHRFYDTTCWSRELWNESSGHPALLQQLPELPDVGNAAGGSRAKQAQREILKVWES